MSKNSGKNAQHNFPEREVMLSNGLLSDYWIIKIAAS